MTATVAITTGEQPVVFIIDDDEQVRETIADLASVSWFGDAGVRINPRIHAG